MKDLDANGDGEVNFEEFVSLVVGLSIACEACYRMQLKNTQSWNLWVCVDARRMKTIKTTFAARLKYSGCVWQDFGLQTVFFEL